MQELNLLGPVLGVHLRLFSQAERKIGGADAQDVLEVEQHDLVSCGTKQGGNVSGTEAMVINWKERHHNAHGLILH
jgi:hypothetical protein